VVRHEDHRTAGRDAVGSDHLDAAKERGHDEAEERQEQALGEGWGRPAPGGIDRPGNGIADQVRLSPHAADSMPVGPTPGS
jgi:hypothetical protein